MNTNPQLVLKELRDIANAFAGLENSMSIAQDDVMLTTKEACALMKVSRWTLMRLRDKGLIHFVKLAAGKSGAVRYFRSSLLSFLNKRKNGGESCNQNA